MKKAKLWITSFLLMGFFLTNLTIVNAAGCTQKRKACTESADMAFYCTGPVTTIGCVSGGCGGPIGPVECSDDPIQ